MMASWQHRRLRGFGASLALLAACGSKAEEKKHGPDHPPYPPDASTAPWKPVVGGLAGLIPTVAAPLPPVSGDAPLAAVIIDADGTVRVAATRGTWPTVTAPGFRDGATVIASPGAELGKALLALVSDGGGPAATRALEMREELEAAAEDGEEGFGTIGLGGFDSVELAFTYAAGDGALRPPATPLLIVHPAAAASQVAEIVDLVGGAFAVADGDMLALLPTMFPWENGAWGGVDMGDDERVSVDFQVGEGRFGFVDARGATRDVELAIDPIAATIKDRIGTMPLAPEPVTDVLVTREADAQHLVAALATLEAAGAPRIGVTVSPWAFISSAAPPRAPKAPKARLGNIQATGGLDGNLVRRIFRQNQQKFVYCYEKQLKVSPALAGALAIELTIDAAGAVTAVKASGVDDTVAACVRDYVRPLRFPEAKSGTPTAVRTRLELRLP